MKQIFVACLCLLIMCSVASAQEEWMPDPNLRQAVREALGLLDGIPLTQIEIQRLARLDAYQKEITDLSGIEHAANLTWLSFAENQIRDLSALAELFKLEILYLWGNPISDISPLANLVDLKALDLDRGFWVQRFSS